MDSVPTPVGPVKLSVAMIVQDAASLLPCSLDNLRSLADEFVVLDTGSSDDTVQIARAAGARTFTTDWRNDFSQARNECAKYATGEWTLWIDAGETIDNLAAEQLRSFIEGSADPSKAYALYVCKPPSGASQSSEQIGQVRLVPTAAGIQFVGRVRETPLPAISTARLEVDVLDCAINRPTSLLEPHTIQVRATRDLRLAEKAIAEHGESAWMLNTCAQALGELDRQAEAAQKYSRAIEIAPRGSTEMLEAYYGLLSQLDAQPERRELQMQTCLEALEIFPLDAQLLCGMGCYLLHQQRLDLAARSYELAATHGQVDPGTWHLTDLADIAVSCQSYALGLLGNSEKALTVLVEALQSRPGAIRLRRQLIDLYIKSQRVADALRELDHLPEDTPHRSLLPGVVRAAAQVAIGHEAEAVPELVAAYASGCRDPLCIRWLAVAKMQLGQLEAAEELLAAWASADPDCAEIASCRLALAKLRQSAASSAQTTPGGKDRSAPSNLAMPHLALGGESNVAPWPPSSV